MIKKIILGFLLLLTVLEATETKSREKIKEDEQRSGLYAGLNIGVFNFLGSVMIDESSSSKSIDVHTKDKHLLFKMGYLRKSSNRVELFVREATLTSEKSSKLEALTVDSTTFGIDYQWGIESYASEKFLPYIRVGLGIGTAQGDYTLDDMFAFELDLGVGAYYHLSKKVDLSAGISRRMVALLSDHVSDNDLIFMGLNGFEISVNYYF